MPIAHPRNRAISKTAMLHCDLRVRWKAASDLRFRAAMSEPKTPSFCGISGDLAQSTRKSLAIAPIFCRTAKFQRCSVSKLFLLQFAVVYSICHRWLNPAYCGWPMSTSRDTSSKPSEAILVACRPIKQVEIRYGRWGMTRGRTEHDKTVRWRQRTPRRSYGEHGESHGENHDKIATTNRASIRARNVMQISPCVFPWLRSHLVEVLLDSCLGASLRIEDGEVSQTLPLKVPQGARRAVMDERWRHEWYIQVVSSPSDGADLPYGFGHVLVHQAFSRRDLPS